MIQSICNAHEYKPWRTVHFTIILSEFIVCYGAVSALSYIIDYAWLS
jgi:hypothetical protein